MAKSRKRSATKQIAKPRNMKSKLKTWVKWLLILLVIIVCWLPAVFINNVIGYAPGIFVTLGILLSRLYLAFLKRGLDYAEATRVSECVREENVDFVLRLKNRSILLYPRIEVAFYQSDIFGGEGHISSTDIILAPKATKDFTFSMRFDHIGVYEAGFKRVTIYDLLGLFKVTYDNDTPQRIEVLPRLNPIGGVTFDSEAPTQSTRTVKTVLNEGMDYSQVREYRWGDPIKSIHWKLSARLEHHVTRIYETSTNPGLSTVIDLRCREKDATRAMQLYDAVVESALSLDDFARRSGLESSLIYMNDCEETRKFEARLEGEGLREIISLLKEDSSCYEGNAASLLQSELNSPFAQSNIALCTCALDNELIEILLAIKLRHKNPILLYVLPEHLEMDERRELMRPLKSLDDAHISYFTFSNVADLSEGAR